ncbi:hypothetical protein [Sporosarcina aquimarina]|uniref:Uncharacterized protein n=1 Tax=Sporosarcina aquimarina TaxID=114975 RepID=A0ABU4G3J7_9BACL|nr:hypothetical protein [Sporosarcina aquimarina]MDW0111538.1 hypothetical protein [Sporosarcina aquimarina]
MKKILNVYGCLAALGLVLTIFTHPITGTDNMRIVFNKELMMSSSEIKEFLLFIFISSITYFFIVNLYFSKKKIEE